MKYIRCTIDFHEAILEITQFTCIFSTTDAHMNPAINFTRPDGRDVFLLFETAIGRDKAFEQVYDLLSQENNK